MFPQATRKRLVLLSGARQTGKTTLLKYLLPDIRYINLDAPENRELLRGIPSASWADDIGNAIIDEAQKEPVVFEKTKYAWDEGGITFTVLSGSSQILLLKKIRESLAGRVSIYELWPLMMSEVHQKRGNAPGRIPVIDLIFDARRLGDIMGRLPSILLGDEQIAGKKAEKYILQWGGMPALLDLTDKERWKWLKDYEYTYLQRDLGDLARLSDLAPFTKFQRLAALRSGQLLNYSELARDAALSVDTARRYLEYLRLSYQVILLQPFYKNLTSSLVKTPKLYWLDIGLLRRLSGFTGEITGALYETMVVGEIFKWIKTLQKDAELYFYRTRSGLELDLLVQTERGLFGIEIKQRDTVAMVDTRAMREIAEHLGDKWLGGMVVYRGDKIEKIREPDIWAVPSYRLFA